MRIIKDDCIVLSIDFQKRLVPAMDNIDEVLENSFKLLTGMNALKIPVIFTRQYPKGLGETCSIFDDIDCEGEYDKISFSCYDDAKIKELIDSFGKKTIIILGIEAHVCVLQTIIDLRAAKYNCVLIADCITSRKQKDLHWGIDRAKSEGAIITSYESLLFELQRVAGNETFKTISSIIK